MTTGVDTRALDTWVKRMYELVTMEPLRPGGRPAIADIVGERPLPESAVCNADLWASGIGGATPRDHYRDAARATACAAFPSWQANPGGDRSCPL
ncbi:hypothetical protein [Amycolatopsis thermoflava]|uniref:hypothetical protein n=1 Tax=Amycolatopsis thermoflava TaxID=84480 RepID=UPI003660FF71